MGEQRKIERFKVFFGVLVTTIIVTTTKNWVSNMVTVDDNGYILLEIVRN